MVDLGRENQGRRGERSEGVKRRRGWGGQKGTRWREVQGKTKRLS